jgi:hypothetical protein
VKSFYPVSDFFVEKILDKLGGKIVQGDTGGTNKASTPLVLAYSGLPNVKR